MADTRHGPFTVLGDPHVGDASRTSFHSQISSVFKVQGKKDLYIACADRWMPNAMDVPYEVYAKYYELSFGFDRDEEAVRQYKQRMKAFPVPDTGISDYVWLPLRFEGDVPRIDWREEWSLDEFE